VTSPLASPVDVLIAVDESASITPAEITLERTAARLIALGEFAPTSKIGILGFGGPNEHYNTTTNPQPPVDPVCPMTEVDSPTNRQALSDCIGKLKTRTAEQGNHTDFIDAINDGVADLTGTGDTGRPLLLFLLTDGGLDMVGSPDFPGTSNAAINAEANQYLLSQTLPAAKNAGVRIWPLGFGPHVDVQELKEIAAGGAQNSCNATLPDATPHEVTVASASQIESELPQIYANARCSNYSPGESAPIGPGGSADLYVNVPDIVSFGSIEVIRQYQQISVTYFDPDNRQVPVPTGKLAGQTFSLAGANGPVESLSVGNPIPGRWRVHLTAGPGVPAGTLVTTSVLWQGVLHFDIVTNPTDPKPGQAVTVTVKLQAGSRPLTADDLTGVNVSVKISGPGLASPISVPVNDNGVPPDQTANDGVYDGTLTVPRSASGTLIAIGQVKAQGVVGDTQSTPITVNSSVLSVTGQMTLPAGSVAPGGQATGTLQLSNPTGKPHTIRLIPEDAPPGVTITPPTISLPAASGTTSYQFTMHFAHSVPVGAVTGHVNAVDAATGALYAQGAITTTVSVPPKIYNHWWFWVLAAFVVGLVALALWLAFAWLGRQRNEISMEQIELILYDGGRPIDTLLAPAGCGSRLPFSIDRSRPGLPRLEPDFGGASEYVARRWRGRRHTGGGIVVIQQGAEPQKLDVQDAPVAALGDGTALGFRDLRLLDPPDDSDTWSSAEGDAEGDEADATLTEPRRHWWQLFGGEQAATVPDSDPDEEL
jgi:hypothetical protein